MPTTDTFADIRRDTRIIHNRYGRGFFVRLLPEPGHASVAFDDDGGVERRVLLRHITPEPANMPAAVLNDRAALSRAGRA